MLYGPPGLGKTTLAHVVASHAGYNVVEMNASDDRSLQAFKVKSRRVNVLWSVLSNYGLVWKSLLDLKWFKWHLANVFLFGKRQINCSQVY